MLHNYFLIFKDRSTECVTDSVRLVRGSDLSEGQVELCVSQFWHPVCDDSFTVNETELICKSLGYDSREKGKIEMELCYNVTSVAWTTYLS